MSARLSLSLRLLQHSMPSNSVPDMFHAGSPAVRQVSRCTWDSMNGGSTSFPPRSTVSSPGSGVSFSPKRSNFPSATRKSTGFSAFSGSAFVNSIFLSFSAAAGAASRLPLRAGQNKKRGSPHKESRARTHVRIRRYPQSLEASLDLS